MVRSAGGGGGGGENEPRVEDEAENELGNKPGFPDS